MKAPLVSLILIVLAGGLSAQAPYHPKSWYEGQITTDTDGIHYINGSTDGDALACQGYVQAADMGRILTFVYAKAIGKSAWAWGKIEDGEDDSHYQNDCTVALWGVNDLAAWVTIQMQNDNPAVHDLLVRFCEGLTDGIYHNWPSIYNKAWFQNIFPNGFAPEHVFAAQFGFSFMPDVVANTYGVATGMAGIDTFFPNDSSDEWVMYDDQGVSWLVIDPHYGFGWGMPDGDEDRGVHTCAVDGDTLHWKGHNALGLPFMGIGVSLAQTPDEESIGWTVTMAGIDVADCYVLKWENQGGVDGYLMEDGWKAIQKTTVQIKFPDNQSLPYEIWSTATDHGPIVHREGDGFGADDKVYAGRANFTVFPDCVRMSEQAYAQLQCEDMDGFFTETGRFMAPLYGNIAVASSGSAPRDRIGYILLNAVPDRRSVPGWETKVWTEPVDGSLYANIWQGVHGFGDLPKVRGDSQAYFINCNASCDLTYGRFKQHVPEYPAYMIYGWGIETFRQQRADELLQVPPGEVDYDLMYAAITDVSHGRARNIIPLISDAYVEHGSEVTDPIVDLVVPIFENWDKRATKESKVMYFYKLWEIAFKSLDPSYGGKFFSFASGLPPETQYPTKFTREEAIHALAAIADAYHDYFLPKYKLTGNITWGGNHYINRITSFNPHTSLRWEVSGDACCLRSAGGNFYSLHSPPEKWQDYFSIDIDWGQITPSIVKMTHAPEIYKFTTAMPNAVDPLSPNFDPACPCTEDWANEEYRDF